MSERIDDLLEKTSRTFALAIPLLPEPTRREVGLAYLLFRVADTLEDAFSWPQSRRLQSLAAFAALLRAPATAGAASLSEAWLADPPTQHEGYLELLSELPLLMAETLALGAEAQAAICKDTIRTTEGMAEFVATAPPGENILVTDLAQLRRYCYTVAGIVGELLTELFLLSQPGLASRAADLRDLSASFGEALQLVNILKDAVQDSKETRSFLPRAVPREDLFELAQGDIEAACSYLEILRHGAADSGVVAFCSLPILLAHRNLELLEAAGPGAKITRREVQEISQRLLAALATDTAFDVGQRTITPKG